MSDAAGVAHRYVIALGSNIRHYRYGSPGSVLKAAASRLDAIGRVEALSPIIASSPIGPSRRTYANAALILRTPFPPNSLLHALKAVEREFGTRRGGRWQARTLDCDIIFWSGGRFASRKLAIPHVHFRTRPFVTGPAAAIAPAWRDPVTHLSLRQTDRRLTRPRPVPR